LCRATPFTASWRRASCQLHALRLRGLRIRRHFHIIHNESRALSASAKAFIELLKPARGSASDA